MPRATAKKSAKPKADKTKTENGDQPAEVAVEDSGSVATAVAEQPAPAELQPPARPVEPVEEEDRGDGRPAGRDVIATSLNIAKLQAMSMTELNHMAKDLGVE